MIRMVLMRVSILRMMIMIIDLLILSTFGSRNVMIISYHGEMFNLILRSRTATYMIKIRSKLRIRVKMLKSSANVA